MFNNFFQKIVSFMRECRKIRYSHADRRWQYGARTLYAGYLRLQTYTQNMQYWLLFNCNNGCSNAP